MYIYIFIYVYVYIYIYIDTVVSGGHDGNTLLLNIFLEFHVAISDAMAVSTQNKQ